jgi:hypothetical protein
MFACQKSEQSWLPDLKLISQALGLSPEAHSANTGMLTWKFYFVSNPKQMVLVVMQRWFPTLTM